MLQDLLILHSCCTPSLQHCAKAFRTMADNMFDLADKVALVTGGNSGLGLAFADGLARAGADVIIWGRRADRNAAAVEHLRRHGGRAESREVDVTDEQAVIDGMAAAVAAFGRIDCVVANAGTATVSPIEEMTGDVWHGLLAPNLHGVFYTCREAARHMIQRSRAGDPGGSISHRFLLDAGRLMRPERPDHFVRRLHGGDLHRLSLIHI